MFDADAGAGPPPLVTAWLAAPPRTGGVHLARRDGWEHWPYPRLAGRSLAFAAALHGRGVRAGDTVAVLGHTGADLVTALFGTIATGAAPAVVAPPPVFGDRDQHARRVAGMLDRARPRLVVTAPRLRDLAAGHTVLFPDEVPATGPPSAGPQPVGPEATALLQFTSGTTTRPRGVAVSHAALETQLRVLGNWIGPGPGRATASWLPLHHDMGLVGCLLSPVAHGGDLWLSTPEQFLRRPLSYLRCFTAGGARLSAMPPFGLDHVCDRVAPADLAGLDLSGWAALIVGAERVPPRTLDRFLELLGPCGFAPGTLLPAYGLAEATLAVTGTPTKRGPRRITVDPGALDLGATVRPADGSGGRELVGCGGPLGPNRVRVVDPADGRPVADAVVGEIAVGDSSAAGPGGAGTAELRTGDAGFLLDGELYVLGRLGDAIKVRGRTVLAEDVEAGLPESVPPAVVALGTLRGEPAVLVAVDGDVSGRVGAALREHLTRHLPVAAVWIRRVPGRRVPRTTSGKPRRGQLWRAFVSGALDRADGGHRCLPARPEVCDGHRDDGPVDGPAGEEGNMLEGTVPVPVEFAERYRADGWWTGRTLAGLARGVDPGRTAVVTARERVSYGELDRGADRLAAGFASIGVRHGDRVVVQLPNRPEFLLTCLALFRIGAIPIPALPSHRRVELIDLCTHADAAVLVVPDVHQRFDHRELAREVAASAAVLEHLVVAGEPDGLTGLDDLAGAAGAAAGPPGPGPEPGDVALLLLSGGTSGRPKLIPRTHEDYALQLELTARAMGFDAGGVYLAALPIAHNAALGCPGVLGALSLGARVVLASSPSPDEVFGHLENDGVTLTTLMPAHLALWAEAAAVLPVRAAGTVVEVGGAQLDPGAALKAEQALGVTVSRWFGISEGVLCCTRPDDPAETRLRTDGRPICPADEIRVVGADGADVEPGEPGELLLRGPYTLRGYYRAPEQNAAAFTADGFFRTGDLVRCTPEGDLVVQGRLKDVINRGGEKIAADELEHHLRAHPAVDDAAALALPDPVLGERTGVVVTLEAGVPEPTLRDLRTFLTRRGCAEFKLPDRLVVVAGSLPLTGVGKVDKRRLEALFSQEDARATR